MLQKAESCHFFCFRVCRDWSDETSVSTHYARLTSALRASGLLFCSGDDGSNSRSYRAGFTKLFFQVINNVDEIEQQRVLHGD